MINWEKREVTAKIGTKLRLHETAKQKGRPKAIKLLESVDELIVTEVSYLKDHVKFAGIPEWEWFLLYWFDNV